MSYTAGQPPVPCPPRLPAGLTHASVAAGTACPTVGTPHFTENSGKHLPYSEGEGTHVLQSLSPAGPAVKGCPPVVMALNDVIMTYDLDLEIFQDWAMGDTHRHGGPSQ